MPSLRTQSSEGGEDAIGEDGPAEKIKVKEGSMFGVSWCLSLLLTRCADIVGLFGLIRVFGMLSSREGRYILSV